MSAHIAAVWGSLPCVLNDACHSYYCAVMRCRDSLMKEMPEMEGQYVKVPKVF